MLCNLKYCNRFWKCPLPPSKLMHVQKWNGATTAVIYNYSNPFCRQLIFRTYCLGHTQYFVVLYELSELAFYLQQQFLLVIILEIDSAMLFSVRGILHFILIHLLSSSLTSFFVETGRFEFLTFIGRPIKLPINYLANLGHRFSFGVHNFALTPQECTSFLCEDLVGVYFSTRVLAQVSPLASIVVKK